MRLAVIFMLVVVAVVRAQLTLTQLQNLATYRTECIEKTGVKKELVGNASRGEIAEDPKLHEHIVCVFKRIGYMDDSGSIQKDVLTKLLTGVVNDKELVEKVVNACAVKKDSIHTTAVENYKCFYQQTGLPVI